MVLTFIIIYIFYEKIIVKELSIVIKSLSSFFKFSYKRNI